MAWIKTIPFNAADEDLRRAIAAQNELYPAEYARSPEDDGSSSIVATAACALPDAPAPMIPSRTACDIRVVLRQ